MADNKKTNATNVSGQVKWAIAELAKANEAAAMLGIKTSILSAQAKAPSEALRRVN